MATELLTERRDGALLMTLRDPATRNALSPEANAAGIEAVRKAAADASVRCLVLRGDGAHFCAGGNVQRLNGVRQRQPEEQAQSMAHFHGFVEALRRCPKPVIAAVEGWAAGGGAALVLACDLVVAAEDARFIFSYGKIGLSPDGGSSWHLGRLLPRGVALRMAWLPEPMSARDWQAHGLVQEVCASGGALDRALALAAQLAKMSPQALASAKELICAAPDRELREQLDAERDHFVRNLFHRNGGEGLQAFIDKRPPDFYES
jgi:enoyl-CoA hydratase/carnithine racemase